MRRDYELLIDIWHDNKEPRDDFDCRAGDPDDGCNCPECSERDAYITEEYEGDGDE